jgi:adenosine deaminase
MVAPSDFAALPKAELHIHLEGSIRPATLEEFCSRTGVTVPKSFNTLNTFIESFTVAWQAMSSPGDYGRMMREYCEDAARAGVRYAEVTMATIGRTFDCLEEATDAAASQSDVTVRIIADIPRIFPIEVAWAVLEGTKGVSSVVGLGLGGPEDGYPPELFKDVFAKAVERGLRSIPHAGEDAGPESVLGALDALKAERIQHGIRSVEDPKLVARLATSKIPLAVCPTSNLLLGVVETLDDHPIRELWDAGVSISVNTDDPGFFDCDLIGEYEIAGRLLGLDREGYGRLAAGSVDGSFAPAALKEELYADIEDWVHRAG